MAAKKTSALTAARALALSGDADAAIEALGPLAESDASAAASLAELLAFRGEWVAVARYAARFIAQPGPHAGNVFDDMVRLLAAAGHRGAPWETIARAAADALAATPSEPPHRATRLRTILESLAGYAAREGAPPHERIEVFGVARVQPTQEQYQAAVAQAEKKPKSTRGAQLAHRIALALSFGQEAELVALVQSAPLEASFAHAFAAARVLAARGERDAAWTLVQPRIGAWSPIDSAQVAPVGLLLDAATAAMMTPARCAIVLATPRALPSR